MTDAATIEEARQLARRVAARTQIRDVRLHSVNADLLKERDPHNLLTYQLGQDAEVEFGDGTLVVTIEYAVTIINPPKDVERENWDWEDALARIRFKMAGLFQVDMRPDDEPATEEELRAYAQSTGGFALYPYAREFVSDLSTRLALPTLTLGVSLIALDEDED